MSSYFAGSGPLGPTPFGYIRVPGTPAPPADDSAFGALKRSTDVSFLRMLTDRVSLEYNTASAGGSGQRFGEPGSPSRWMPIPGFEEIPCNVALMPPEVVEGAAQTQWVTPAIVTFGVAITADTRHRIIYNHPTVGPMPLYFRGPVKEQRGAHHWTGYCQNREV